MQWHLKGDAHMTQNDMHQFMINELMAGIHALSIWKHFLLGADLIIKSDHQCLRYFLTQRKLSEKQYRWANFLSLFHFQIMHMPGHKNVIVDALSQRPKVNAISMIYHNEFSALPSLYEHENDFKEGLI